MESDSRSFREFPLRSIQRRKPQYSGRKDGRVPEFRALVRVLPDATSCRMRAHSVRRAVRRMGNLERGFVVAGNFRVNPLTFHLCNCFRQYRPYSGGVLRGRSACFTPLRWKNRATLAKLPVSSTVRTLDGKTGISFCRLDANFEPRQR